mmetsp:Transcript_22227/g.30315  ORF Transcript_22227/g.30315 Transcript_22227/m.30315 type:complete len:106 (-) Transcript_22227:426-743(-)
MESFDDFSDRVKLLYTETPEKTRLVVKYNHPAGKVILRVTNDQMCFIYNTDEAADLKKLEKLNEWVFEQSCGISPISEASTLDTDVSRPTETQPSSRKRRQKKRK